MEPDVSKATTGTGRYDGIAVVKVVHVNEHLARKGGVETYLLSLLPMLEVQGVGGHVIYGQGDPALWEASSAAPDLGQADFRRDATAREQVSDILAREQPDIVHIHNVQNLGALKACVEYGCTIMTTHDYRAICPANTFFFKRTAEVCQKDHVDLGCFAASVTKRCLTPRPHFAAYFYQYARWSVENVERFARVIAPSHGAGIRLRQAGFPPEHIDVLPYFCPIEPAREPRPLPERPTITYMGRISPNKGHQYFIEALGKLPDVVCGVMVGNFRGGGEHVLRKLASEHGCADRLELRQWASREEVRDIIDNTTVFIFPSTWPETLGIVGLEALARGVPVVASDVGGVREWLQHARNGYLVVPKDTRSIAARVRELIEDRDKLLKFGREGIATINERFLPEQHVRRLVSIYEKSIVDHPQSCAAEYV